MEDVFKFLLIAAVIVIGLIRQFKKEADKNAEKSPDMPMPDSQNPLPEHWGGDTYGGYIPEGPAPVQETAESASRPSAPQKRSNTPEQTFRPGQGTASRAPHSASPAASNQQKPDEASEFGIQSVEEARKAIIWSEILKRKY